jgi:uncharacterized protein YndB with AHSA1/START domain
MTREKSLSTVSPVRELIITRVFNAPRELVFEAWIEREHLERWWGPHGFTNPVCEVDARPGGGIRIDMTGPDGVVYPMTGVFHEIVKPERLVFTTWAHMEPGGNPGLEIHNTVTFAEQDGKTALTLKVVVVKAAPEMAGPLEGMEIGWTQSLERLENELKDPADREFFIVRGFDAPRDLVFKAWTEADRLVRWFGPKGFAMLTCKLDLRPGGVFHYSMRSPDGQDMWGKWVFREIITPERLTFVVSFSDENGGVTRNPFAPDSPLEHLGTVTFAELGGRTILTIRSAAIDATETQRKAFGALNEMRRKGWSGTLDQLAEVLADCQAGEEAKM